MTEQATAKTPAPQASPGAPAAGLGELGRTTSPRGWLALGAATLVIVGALVYGLFGTIPVQSEFDGTITNGSYPIEIAAGIAGTVELDPTQLRSTVEKNAKSKSNVKKGQQLMTIVPFGGGAPVSIKAPEDMQVALRVVDGTPVSPASIVANGSPTGNSQNGKAQVYAFLSQADIKTIEDSKSLSVTASAPNLAGDPAPIELVYVDPVSVTQEHIAQLTGNQLGALNSYKAAGGAPYEALFKYTNASDANKVEGTADATITVTESDSHPLQLLFGN